LHCSTVGCGDHINQRGKVVERGSERRPVQAAGSSELVNTLMWHRLIDVYRLMLCPLTLGTGGRFFRDGGDKNMLTLTSAKTTSGGVAVLTCQSAD
jgi:dihydrofolate reductase